ncbi:hypothetical protein HYU12_04015 [Candidatus Woesearchaeota archaeon]|nr:hypothetical protein [Candidatus Woesearchaeota archaeon]
MKALVFDSGPLISMTMNNLLWLLEPLKGIFKGEFYIPESVKSELVDDAFDTKKFKFEALQVEELLSRGVVKVLADRITKPQTIELLQLANSCFSVKGRPLNIVHYGEIASVAAASHLDASALVLDERITRELIEHPQHLAKIIEKKLHTRVDSSQVMIDNFRRLTKDTGILRSAELAAIAFEKRLLERYATSYFENPREAVLESVLWGLKMDGCAINERGIKAILKSEGFR